MLLSLQTENRRVWQVVSQIGTLLGKTDSFDKIFTAPMRWEFARMLMQHMSYKDAVIYHSLLQGCPPEARKPLEGLRERGQQLFADYRVHMSFWSDERIREDLPEYRSSMLDLIARFSRAIELERELVYPLLRTNMISACDGEMRDVA